MGSNRFAWGVMSALVLVMAMIAVVDALTGRQISLWVAYIVPVASGAWLLGFRLGGWLALLAGLLLGVVGLVWGNLFSSDWFFAFAILSRTACFIFIAWLCHRLRLTQELEHTVRAYEELCESLNIGLVERRAPGKGVKR
jgi:thiamine transporter ThiT